MDAWSKAFIELAAKKAGVKLQLFWEQKRGLMTTMVFVTSPLNHAISKEAVARHSSCQVILEFWKKVLPIEAGNHLRDTYVKKCVDLAYEDIEAGVFPKSDTKYLDELESIISNLERPMWFFKGENKLHRSFSCIKTQSQPRSRARQSVEICQTTVYDPRMVNFCKLCYEGEALSDEALSEREEDEEEENEEEENEEEENEFYFLEGYPALHTTKECRSFKQWLTRSKAKVLTTLESRGHKMCTCCTKEWDVSEASDEPIAIESEVVYRVSGKTKVHCSLECGALKMLKSRFNGSIQPEKTSMKSNDELCGICYKNKEKMREKRSREEDKNDDEEEDNHNKKHSKTCEEDVFTANESE